MTLKLGFVGVGGIARRHLKNASARDDVVIVGHADIVPERAAAAAEAYGGNAYPHCCELYDAEEPDALVIATPPDAHGEIEEEAVQRGIHFFVEKPVAVDLARAERVKQAVDSAGILVQVGYMMRFAEGIRKAKELLEDRAIAMVQQHYYMPGMPPKDWYADIGRSGGQLTEQATHMLDCGRFLAGDVTSVRAQTIRAHDWRPEANQPHDGLLWAHPDFSIPDTTAMVMEYAGGAIGTLSCSMVPGTAWDSGFRIVAEGMIVVIDGGSVRWSGAEQGETKAGNNWPSYVLYDFLDAVSEGHPATTVPYDEGIRSLAISLAGYESVRQNGAPVDPTGLVAHLFAD